MNKYSFDVTALRKGSETDLKFVFPGISIFALQSTWILRHPAARVPEKYWDTPYWNSEGNFLSGYARMRKYKKGPGARGAAAEVERTWSEIRLTLEPGRLADLSGAGRGAQ